MKLAVILLAWVSWLANPPRAEAHCYSVWNYPTPQRCGVYARARERPAPVLRVVDPPVPPVHDIGIPIPDMTDINWGGMMDSELELSLQRQKAIRLLTIESK